MKRVRILVGTMPQMLRDIVAETVRLQPDMELVDNGSGHDLSMQVKSEQAEVVIVAGGEADGPTLYEQLLLANPHLKVLVLTRDGREAHILELRHTPILEVSPQGLVDAIREAVAPRAS